MPLLLNDSRGRYAKPERRLRGRERVTSRNEPSQALLPSLCASLSQLNGSDRFEVLQAEIYKILGCESVQCAKSMV